MTSPLITFYRVVDVVGSALGIVTNVLLLIAIFRSSRSKLQAYSYMFLFTACFDLAYSVLELLIQHLVISEEGKIFIFPFGIERLLPADFALGIFFFHCFLAMNSVFLLPCQYLYRYQILQDPHTTVWSLVKSVAIASAVACLCAANAVWMVLEQRKRPAAYYQEILERAQIEGREAYMLGADMVDDLATRFFYQGLGFVTSNVAIGLCVFYAWKSWHFVQEREGVAVSTFTRSLQKQFTRSLIVQTVNSFIFAMSPISLLIVSMVIRQRILGLYLMLPVSWLPTANALTTIGIIKAYRRYVLFLCGGKSPDALFTRVTTSVAPTEG
ncbi:hypothetical protein M3Y99_00731800 [Aphelenchoides fujianensis]|nr:hypothetical protein M3Y99_00731800 [Aphelenchoides fujianensis]